MNLTMVAIAALIVVGIVSYLILARREEAKKIEALRLVNKKLWTQMLSKPESVDAQRVRAELEAIQKMDHEARTKAILERLKK